MSQRANLKRSPNRSRQLTKRLTGLSTSAKKRFTPPTRSTGRTAKKTPSTFKHLDSTRR